MFRRSSRFLLILSLLTSSCSTTSTQSLEKPSTANRAPASGLNSQLVWVLSIFNDKQGQITEDEIKAHFADSFLQEKPAAELVPLMGSIAKELGKVRSVSQEKAPEQAGMDGLIEHVQSLGGKAFRIILMVNEGDGKIAGLLIQPDDTPSVPKSVSEVQDALRKSAEKTSIIAAEIRNGRCEKPLFASHAKDALAIGSAFKLYVLGATIDALKAGELTWTDPIRVEDKLKSLPSGTMQDKADGKSFPVFDVAQGMISISDNTATDHLMNKLGRDKVEAALKAYGNQHAVQNIPMLNTREFFLLKKMALQGRIGEYLKKDATGRRIFLDRELAGQSIRVEDLSDWKTPQSIDNAEWFASGEDICRAMARFQKDLRGNEGEELGRILSKNPGVPFERKAFPFIGFKGGSEVGVASLSWILKRKDGRWFVLSLTVNDSKKQVDLNTLIGIAQGAAELIAKSP